MQIRGQVERRDETVSLRATEFQVPTLEAEDERPLVITLPQVALNRDHVMRLGRILNDHPGYCEVRLAIMDDQGNAKVLVELYRVAFDPLKEISFISDEYNKFELEGSLLADTTKPYDAVLGQFGRIVQL